MNLPILYEDADIVAVDKPAGLVTHSDGRTKEATAEDWFKEKYQSALASPERSGGGYVHRLDRDTSGVLVFAKNGKAYDFLRKAFTDREVKKEYLAFVYGVPREKSGTIDFDIGRSRKDFRLRSAQPKARGTLRAARTRYEVLGMDEERKHSLLKVEPETGRTHQIRVHLKAIHHPIVCDPLYAPKQPHDLGLTRLGLHAYQIELPLPPEQNDTDSMIYHTSRVTITSPIPDDLKPAFLLFPEANATVRGL